MAACYEHTLFGPCNIFILWVALVGSWVMGEIQDAVYYLWSLSWNIRWLSKGQFVLCGLSPRLYSWAVETTQVLFSCVIWWDLESKLRNFWVLLIIFVMQNLQFLFIILNIVWSAASKNNQTIFIGLRIEPPILKAKIVPSARIGDFPKHRTEYSLHLFLKLVCCHIYSALYCFWNLLDIVCTMNTLQIPILYFVLYKI